jgi:hypothetical protein
MDPSWLDSLAKTPSDVVESAGTELRFGHQDAITGTATVSFQQTHFGLPIWEAGFTVSMLTEPATGSLSTVHAEIKIRKPNDDADCARGRITPQNLAKLLHVERSKDEIVINAERTWVYCYDETQRLPRGPSKTGSELRRGPRHEEAPTLPLRPVDRSIVDGHHYVVTELLFDLPLPRFPRLHWRAFIEVDTCSVLYLRALIASYTGSVYLTDPIAATGDDTITAGSSAAILDPLRTDVTLQGLTAATPQALTGSYVTVLQGSGPYAPPTVVSPHTDFTYSVPTPNFAAVCACHHVDELFRLVVSFGYSPITTFFQNTSFPVPIYFLENPDDDGEAVTSLNATSNGFGSISCGIEESGCTIGIVTDWRIMMHEFVHGMLCDRIHATELAFAHNGGDGFGAIYMDPGSKARDRGLTFPWVPILCDPTNPLLLRRHDRDVRHGWAWGGPQEIGSDGNNYIAEQILSTTLFRVYARRAATRSIPTSRHLHRAMCCW